jgi:hypothetical protein
MYLLDRIFKGLPGLHDSVVKRIHSAVYYCHAHGMYSLLHGNKKHQKEVYIEEEMLTFDVTAEELATARSGTVKCVCFPWVMICFLSLFSFY